jgi:outer membrane protein assembly factor BamB
MPMRPCLGAVVLVITLLAGSHPWAAAGDAIISEPAAGRHGLTRSWLAQVELDRARSRVTHITLHAGTLYVQTTQSMLAAIDAETGHPLWTKRIGRPDFPTLPVAVGEDLVALINGSQLFILNRYNGEMLSQTKIAGSPNAGPALSDKAAYVPIGTGAVLAYPLELLADPAGESGTSAKDMSAEQQKAAEATRRDNLRLNQEPKRPAVCQSNGQVCVPPILIRQERDDEVVAWPTDRGAVTVARLDHRDMGILPVKYEMKTDGAILAKLAYLPPDPKVNGDAGLIFAASANGYVYAVTENGNNAPWKFPASEPLIQPPTVIGNRVYFVTQLGGMFCCDAKTGKQLWWAPKVLQFVAASKQRVYASDRTGQTLVLDARTGARLDVLSTELLPIKLLNSETDRLYLATDTGLVQCLHEIEQVKPILHGEDRKPKKVESPEKRLPTAKKAKSDQGDQERPKAAPKAPPKAPPKTPPKKPKDKAAKKTDKADKDAADNG